jgi:hypothetical protein
MSRTRSTNVKPYRPKQPPSYFTTPYPVPLSCGHEAIYRKPVPRVGGPAWCPRCCEWRRAVRRSAA